MRERFRALLLLGSASLRADPARAVLATGLSIVAAVAGPVFALAAGFTADRALHEGLSAATWAGAAAAALAIVGIFVIGEVEHHFRRRLQEKASHQLDRDLMRMIAGMPGLQLQDDPAFHNEVAAFQADHWLLGQAVEAVIASTALLLQMIATVLVLARVAPVLLLLPVFAIPNLVAGNVAERIRIRSLEKTAEERRRGFAAFENSVDPAAGMEVRLLGLRDLLMERFLKPMAVYAREEYVHTLQGAVLTSGGAIVFAIGFTGALAYLAIQLQHGRISTGALITAIIMGGEISHQLGAAASRSAWLGWATSAVIRYVRILDRLKAATVALEAAGAGPCPSGLTEGIRLEQISFRYPGSDREVLRQVDLDLPAGAVVAVVGDNGAGKTTLVKILSRFYEPTGGRVIVDGRDLHTIRLEDWRRRMTVAFQDYARLQLLARDEVGSGDLPRIDDDPAIVSALERAHASDVLDHLPHGLDQQLGTEFEDGAGLSGGQWQKLALGRTMMRDDPLLIVLDEPTASLDPASESALFERYATLARSGAAARGAITILVSHRFATVQTADLIVVLADGRVAEQGSHAELLTRRGIYAEMYETQVRAYR